MLTSQKHGNANIAQRYNHAILPEPPSSLHTGMYYAKGEKAGFCTVSESKRQDAASIWANVPSKLRTCAAAQTS